MASYAFTANANVQSTANLLTDRVRISTSSSGVQVNASFPNVAVTGNITSATNTANVTGVGTVFTTQLTVGTWLGNGTGVTVGIVSSIANNTSLTLRANANVAIANTTAVYNPYGVATTVATANSQIIPANTTNNTFIVGQGNVITFLNVTGATAGPFSITELGMPHSNTGTSGF